jgi:UDP:flavonoid glycosyltransferase YjiC (YdhE family)
MKILATSCPNQGHLFPMISTLWALRNAGHEVLVALPERFAGIAAQAGLPSAVTAPDFRLGDLGTKNANQGSTVSDLIEHVIDYYVPAAEITVQGTVDLATRFRPDLVLCTDWEYAAPIAAAAVGVPTVLHGWGLLAHPDMAAPVAEALAPLHGKWGLHDGAPPHWRIIDNCPEGLQWMPPPQNAIASRYAPYNGSGVAPLWLFDKPGAPRILVTLGNVPISGDHTNVLARTLRGLEGLDVEIVVAVGDHLELGRSAALADNVRVIQGLPLSHILPSCAAVIHHGGAGSAMSATMAGVPQLGLPQMCVQYQHADRIGEVGAGVVLHPQDATDEAIADAMRVVLDEAGPREVVANLRVENDARPRLDETVQSLELALGARS